MVAVPAVKPPVTTPDVRPTVATVLVLLVQVPPVIELDSVVDKPEQSAALPVIGAVGFTVIVLLATQLPPSEYVSVAVPAARPVTSPVDMFTRTIEVKAGAVHVPPGIPSV